LVIGLMLTCTINATFVLVAISWYNTVDREMPFDEFWKKYCEKDWVLAFKCFIYGVPLFIIVLALVGWIVFPKKDNMGCYIIVGTAISVIAVGVLFMFLIAFWKWHPWLNGTSEALTSPPDNCLPHERDEHD